MKYDYERWNKEATLVLFDNLPAEDSESFRQLLLDAIHDSDFLKIDLSQVDHISPICGELLFSFSNREKELAKRILIYRGSTPESHLHQIENGNDKVTHEKKES